MSWCKALLLGALFGGTATALGLWEAGDILWATGQPTDTLPVWAFLTLTPGQFVPMFVYDLTGTDAKSVGLTTIFLTQILLWSVLAVVILALCRVSGCCRAKTRS